MKTASSARARAGSWILGGGVLTYSIAFLLTRPSTPSAPQPDEVAAVGIGNLETLRAAYARWKPQYERFGGERRLGLGLRWTKGLSARFTRAQGNLVLDMEGGGVCAAVTGLSQDETYDLWLVDNEPGVDRSVAIEPGDELLLVGSFRHEDGVANLLASTDRERLADFDLDLAVVAPSGSSPAEEGLLYAVPDLFHRVYHEGRESAFRLRVDPYVEAVAAPVPVALTSGLALISLAFPAAPAALPVPSPATAIDGVPCADQLVTFGERLFFDETFRGNGRTCASCHPSINNFTIDPAFIATLPPRDPLFVAEFRANLAGLEKPELMRSLGLVLENVDGFENPGVMRGTPHVLALGTSIAPAPLGLDGTTMPPLERTGWGGDGAPGDGTLREFAIGAVTQHATKDLERVVGRDFRLPSEYELDALEAFQLSLGRSEDPDLTEMQFKSPIVSRGQELFLDELPFTPPGPPSGGRCHSCHSNAGANASPLFLVSNGFPQGSYNLNLDIGTQTTPETLGEVVAPGQNPRDQGFGRSPHADGGFGNGTQNVPPLIEAADTAPFFHDHQVLSLDTIIQFYFTPEFTGSPAASDPAGPGLQPIQNTPFPTFLTTSDVSAVSRMLRALNTLENIRSADAYLDTLRGCSLEPRRLKRVYDSALADVDDALDVLTSDNWHDPATKFLKQARNALLASHGTNLAQLNRTEVLLAAARAEIVEE